MIEGSGKLYLGTRPSANAGDLPQQLSVPGTMHLPTGLWKNDSIRSFTIIGPVRNAAGRFTQVLIDVPLPEIDLRAAFLSEPISRINSISAH